LINQLYSYLHQHDILKYLQPISYRISVLYLLDRSLIQPWPNRIEKRQDSSRFKDGLWHGISDISTYYSIKNLNYFRYFFVWRLNYFCVLDNLMDYNQIRTLGTTLSIALFIVSIMISSGAVRLEASKSISSNNWCYVSAFPEDRWVCFQDHDQCNKAYVLDLFKSDSCFKGNIPK